MNSEFLSLRVAIPGTQCIRHLYLKRHQAQPDPEVGKNALFVAGIPFKLRKSLEGVFNVFGGIKKVQLHHQQTSAVILFSEDVSIKRALHAARKNVLAKPDFKQESSTGLRAYIQTHKDQFVGNEELQRILDTWMEEYEDAEERKRRAAEQAAADDGWTVVTRKPGRKRNQGSTVSGGVSLAAAEEHAKRKKPKLFSDFYRFQAKEKKRNELLELQKDFSDAKRQLHAIRANRRAVDKQS